jgi:hypothetical protein
VGTSAGLARYHPSVRPKSPLPVTLITSVLRNDATGLVAADWEKGNGKGHGPIAILSVSSGSQRVRQIPIPTHLKQEVEEGVRRFIEIQTLLKQISRVNQDLLEERKKR